MKMVHILWFFFKVVGKVIGDCYIFNCRSLVLVYKSYIEILWKGRDVNQDTGPIIRGAVEILGAVFKS